MSKLVKVAPETLRVKVPQKDETLPNGSVIHWTEICREYPFKRSLYLQLQVPVTCGRKLPHCLGKRLVLVKTGLNRPEGLSADSLASNGKSFSGTCHGCGRPPKHPPVEHLPNGATVFWNEESSSGVPYRCAKCKEIKYLLNPRSNPNQFRGICHSCAVRKRIGIEEHHSGAKILWSTRTPVKRNPTGGGDFKVAYICAGCKQVRDPIRSSIVSRQEWRGLCPGCRRQAGSPRRLKHEKRLLSGSTILYWKRDPNDYYKVAIRCGWCGDEFFSGNKSVFTKKVESSRYLGICPKHTKSELALGRPIAAHGNNLRRDSGAEKGQWGGARNVKWTLEKEDRFLKLYEEMHTKIKGKDASIPEEVRSQLLLTGNQPSDVARDYAAQLLGVESNDYLRTVLTRARARRKEQNALPSRSKLKAP
jgi:hypothetical protein